MPSFTASDVKKLRELTGAGMMDCKKALDEADGDFDKAVELLRVKGAAKAAERGAEREASPAWSPPPAAPCRAQVRDRLRRQERGLHRHAQQIADAADPPRPPTPRPSRPSRSAARPSARSSRTSRSPSARRSSWASSPTSTAPSSPTCTSVPPTCRPPSACSSSIEGDAAPPAPPRCRSPRCRPQYLTRDEVPADVVEPERAIAEQTTREEGKPEQAIAKIVEGRLNGFFKEIVLLEQASVTETRSRSRPSSTRPAPP